MQLHISTSRLLCLTLLAMEVAWCVESVLKPVVQESGNTDATREKRGTLNSESKEDALSNFIDNLSPQSEDQQQVDKRGWKSLSSWGKRKWVNLSPWGGKRRWARVQSWGKRSEDPIEKEITEGELVPEASDNQAVIEKEDKRGWKQMASWGKRDSLDQSGNEEPDNMDKRKWTSYASWGKRDDENLDNDMMDKRKWSQMSSWGKRNNFLTDELYNAIKRKWTNMASWGKRSNWNAFSSWGKRNLLENSAPLEKRGKWSSFSSWGKRDGAENSQS